MFLSKRRHLSRGALVTPNRLGVLASPARRITYVSPSAVETPGRKSGQFGPYMHALEACLIASGNVRLDDSSVARKL